MKRNWAIIGMGFISSRHIQAIKEIGDELLLTCDIDPTKNPDFTDWQEMIQNPIWDRITHVAICTPNYLHYPMCLGVDKTVLCEKPLTIDSSHQFPSNVYTVLQLRHHPLVKKLKRTIKRKQKHTGSLVIRVKRDQNYWDGWKGQEWCSGGIVFNIGVHYIDLLIYLFGNKYKVIRSEYTANKAEGTIDFNGSCFDYYFEILAETARGQDRSLEIDGSIISLSNQDNLSLEDLHKEVYKDLKRGKGITSEEALKSIKLCEKLTHGT